MALLKVVYHPTNRIARVLPNATATPAGYTSKGTFNHDDVNDKEGTTLAHNHVLYHHVRDVLYKSNPSIQDMGYVTVQLG